MSTFSEKSVELASHDTRAIQGVVATNVCMSVLAELTENAPLLVWFIAKLSVKCTIAPC
jgi:hypothetical protein